MSDRDPLQSLWASQQEEPFSMSLADIHERAAHFRTRIRARNRIEHAASALVIAAFLWIGFVAHDPIVRAGCLLIVAATVFVSWRIATMARAGETPDMAESWADFHHARLVRERDALRSVWRWYLGPFVPGLIVFLAGVAFAPDNSAPPTAKALVFLLGAAVIGAMFAAIGWMNLRAARTLQKEIDALDAARGEGAVRHAQGD
jgi:hypothetical protein